MAIMLRTFNFGDTTTRVAALSTGRNRAASSRPRARIFLHLRIYRFSDGGQSFASRPEFHSSGMNLGFLMDPRHIDAMIPDILSHTRYNDPDTRRFWEEKIIDFVANVSLMAFNAAVRKLELMVEIHIRNMPRQLLEEDQATVELMTNISNRGIGAGDFGGVPASEASIDKLEVAKFNGVVGEFEENGCSIFLEEIGVRNESD